MKLKIYQISQSRDAHQVKFMGTDRMVALTGSSQIDASIYDEVFNGEVECSDLEEVFMKFNTEGHPLHRGHSLSVSDVVVTDEGAFFCESIGFLPIGFDECKTQKPDSLLKIVYVEPGKAPFVSEVGSDLKSMQKAVDGYIQPIYLGDGTILVCDDEAKLKGSAGNRRLGDSIIAEPFFIAGEAGESFRSLTDTEIEKYMKKFAQSEQITQ